MKADYITLKNILDYESFEKLKLAGRNQRYTEVKVDADSQYYAPVPTFLNDRLNINLKERLDFGFEDLRTLFRLNTTKKDTNFRIHSDSNIGSAQPDWAMVVYLEDHPASGTGLFHHARHGDRAACATVFTQYDPDWKLKFFQPEVANTAFVYRAELFHGRLPWIARGANRETGRVVLVKFIKEISC